MPEVRKLSTILFADITGYTALMQSDEARALAFLQIFKGTLERTVPEFQGEIVQYFGDACLLSFDSTSKAVRCAMSLQESFQKDDLPVRIGMHLGEVVFRENNAFGDGVNIASRIESMGVPGAILLSRTVRDQIKNKSEFELASLGAFEFKNVEEPLEVYAISNPGFTLPPREELQGKFKETTKKHKNKWKIPAIVSGLALMALVVWFISSGSSAPLSEDDRKKPVAVLPFDNQTKDAGLDAFGLMAMDWIGRGLLESGEARVIQDQTQLATSTMTDLPAGTELVIRGRYYDKGGEELMITCDVIDVKSNTVLHSLEPMTGNKSDPLDVLNALQQKLVGYWKLEDQFVDAPPRYDAYEAFIEGVFLVEDFPYNRKVTLLNKALDLDSTYTDPLFVLYSLGHWGGRGDLKEPALASLQQRSEHFSPYLKLKWESLKAINNGDWVASADIEWELYLKYNDVQHAKGAFYNYRAANHMTRIVELYEEYRPKDLDTNAREIFVRYTEALYELGEFDKILAAIETLPSLPTYGQGVYIHLYTLVRLRQFEELDRMLEFYKTYPIDPTGWHLPSSLLVLVCNEMYTIGMEEEMHKYLGMLQEWLTVEDPNHFVLSSLWAAYYLLKEDYPKMYEEGVKLWDNYKLNIFGGRAGIALYKMGKDKELDVYIEELKSRPNPSPGQSSYAIAAIVAQRDKEEAMKWLKIARDEGYEFNFYSHRHDPAFKEMLDYPPFMELTEPR